MLCSYNPLGDSYGDVPALCFRFNMTETQDSGDALKVASNGVFAHSPLLRYFRNGKVTVQGNRESFLL